MPFPSKEGRMANARLHDLVMAYKAGLVDRETIFERIASEIYANPSRFGFDGEDDAADALCRYRRRIRGLPDRYQDMGAPFEAFLVTSLRFLARTMRRERKREREREYVCEVSEGWKAESMASDCVEVREILPGPLPGPPPSSGRSEPTSLELAAFRIRLVFLYLKCAWDADDEKTRLIAEASGVPEDWLAAALAQALRALEAERCRYERLSRKRDRAWSRVCLLETRLRAEVEDDKRSRLQDSLGRERRCLESARREIRAFRPTVPNSVVARILGVPKGTVDSGLYYLKRREPVRK
jgi:hypothetical protein